MQRFLALRRSCKKTPALLRLAEYDPKKNYNPSRAEPDYESPYFGNPYNENKSGLSEDMDLMWDNDGVQKEWIMNRTAEHIPSDKLWLQLFYLLGWWFGCYQLYCLFLRNSEPLHPMTNVILSKQDFDEIQRLREKRLNAMEKYNIE